MHFSTSLKSISSNTDDEVIILSLPKYNKCAIIAVYFLISKSRMYNSIKTFAEQFAFKPVIENKSTLKKYSRYILIGMGGSGLPAKILKTWQPETSLIVHQNYGLPPYSTAELKQSLIICCSHSGTTEEVLDGFDTARKKNLALAVIATGSALLERAQKFNVPYIIIPKTGTQPRMATGLMLNALLALMKENKSLYLLQHL